VIPTVRHYANDFIQANAEFQSRAGLDPKIMRQSAGDAKVCAWCRGLVWSGDYDDRPDDIYRRHNYCRCMVLFQPHKGAKYTDVHSKKEYNSVRGAKIANNKNTFLTNKTKQAQKRGLIPVNSHNKRGIIITNKSFGEKIRQHAKDFGLDPSLKKDRAKMLKNIDDIINNAEEITRGNWRGQEGEVFFFIKGENVVVTNGNRFVTILKGGVNNARVKNSRKR
jgi:hypothetical protein